MSSDGRPPTRAEKSAAWLACAGTVAALAWTTYAAYGRVAPIPWGDRRPLPFVETGCLLWLFLVAVVAAFVSFALVGYALVGVVSWVCWALTNDVAGKPDAGGGLDEEEWR